MNISDKIPFDIPENWCWANLKNVSKTQTGTTPPTSKKEFFSNEIPFIKPGDILNEQINYNNEGLSFEGLKHGRLIKSNSILMVCIGGSLGKCALNNVDVSCNQQINTATPDLNIITPDFLFNVLRSDYFFKEAISRATGSATPILNRGQWEQILIPIPPISEQKIITKKVNSILNFH